MSLGGRSVYGRNYFSQPHPFGIPMSTAEFRSPQTKLDSDFPSTAPLTSASWFRRRRPSRCLRTIHTRHPSMAAIDVTQSIFAPPESSGCPQPCLVSSILASKVPEGGSCVVYRCGEFVDPCRGRALPSYRFPSHSALPSCSSNTGLQPVRLTAWNPQGVKPTLGLHGISTDGAVGRLLISLLPYVHGQNMLSPLLGKLTPLQ